MGAQNVNFPLNSRKWGLLNPKFVFRTKSFLKDENFPDKLKFTGYNGLYPCRRLQDAADNDSTLSRPCMTTSVGFTSGFSWISITRFLEFSVDAYNRFIANFILHAAALVSAEACAVPALQSVVLFTLGQKIYCVSGFHPSLEKTCVSKIFIAPSKCSFLFVSEVLLKKTVCIKSVVLQYLYFSSRGYYSVCHFFELLCNITRHVMK